MEYKFSIGETVKGNDTGRKNKSEILTIRKRKIGFMGELYYKIDGCKMWYHEHNFTKI